MRIVDPTRSVGDLAVQLPSAACVFVRHGIDFCCSGPRTLNEVCELNSIEPDSIIEEIDELLRAKNVLHPKSGSIEARVAFVVERFFHPSGRALSSIENLMTKSAEVGCPGDHRRRSRFQAVFFNFATRLRDQNRYKETVLFQSMQAGLFSQSEEIIQQLQSTQRQIVRHLRILHRLSSGFDHTSVSCLSEKASVTLLRELALDLAAQFDTEQHLLYSAATFA